MKILVLTNNGGGLYKFRKELLQELVALGNEVYISLPNHELITKLEEFGCKYIETEFDRRGQNPFSDLKLLKFYHKIITKISPDVVLTYTVKPNIYGGIACRITKTPYLVNITGLGTVMENKGAMQRLVTNLYKIAIKKANCVFFQNKMNKHFFINNNLVKGKTRLIPGSGVNLKDYKYENYPVEKNIIKFLFIGRIMKDKGIDELLIAAKEIKQEYHNAEFHFLGEYEESYSEIFSDYENKGLIKYYGGQNDVKPYIKQAHAIVLPSYHEGISNVLLEAAASGRPILASRVAGCQETFDEGISGFGFEVKDAGSLTKAIKTFIELPHEEKKKMGINGRKKMEKEYNRREVILAYLEEIGYIKEQYR